MSIYRKMHPLVTAVPYQQNLNQPVGSGLRRAMREMYGYTGQDVKRMVNQRNPYED